MSNSGKTPVRIEAGHPSLWGSVGMRPMRDHDNPQGPFLRTVRTVGTQRN